MKKSWYIAVFCLVFLCIAGPAFGAPRKITIKLASLVPEKTPWGAALNRMAAEWSKASNGEVELKIYHNGIMGSEEDVLRKLKTNSIQGAVLSTFGLNTITPEIMTLSCPFLIRDNTELDLVMNDLKPELERRINENGGFYTLAWSKVGWVRFFSKTPIFTPDDMRRQKLGTSETEPALMDAFKAMGYQMVPVSMTSILINLTGGMIDAVYQSPVNVGAMQIFGVAKNMADINIAPFMGGIVLNQTSWRSIPDKYKPDLIRIAKRMETELDSSIRELEAGAIEIMGRHGLVTNQLSPAQKQLWYDDMARITPMLLGKTFKREIYERIETIIQAHRAGR
ncbi:hypothetical protein FACS1894137_13390 [Spirochaetia bacterium]|nr:hypothetical protein FACS1894137_13390 [Spirochaetia bacterium]